MNTQPEALHIAHSLEAYPDALAKAAAAELRRLHEVNQELLEALHKCSDQLTRLGYSANHADATIAKASN